MLKFLIKVRGHDPYRGLFPSNLAARQDAEARFLSDPVVKQLMAQGAKLVDGSIRPIEE